MISFSFKDIPYDPEKHEIKPICRCDLCKGDVFPGELVHFIDGTVICPDCFFDFAFDYFSDKLILSDEIRR